jgi:hypothetical protein
MTDYLTKPIDKTLLLKMIRKCITSALLVVALGSTHAVQIPDGPTEKAP